MSADLTRELSLFAGSLFLNALIALMICRTMKARIKAWVQEASTDYLAGWDWPSAPKLSDATSGPGEIPTPPT